MKPEKLFVPANIWGKLVKDTSHSTYTGNIVLKNGSVYRKVFFDHRGLILGEIVGGHDGISTRNFDFSGEDIKEIRRFSRVAEPKGPRQSAIYMSYRRVYGWIRKMARRHL